jgi:hypothetical protein
MKITNNSKKLISFFHKYNCLPHIKQTKATNYIFKHFFHEINDAVNFVSYTKSQKGQSFYNLKINKINHISQIPKPATFNADVFPTPVREHIDEYSLSSLTYSFRLFGRQITIHFLIEDDNPEIYINKYNTYVDHILAWLFIVNEYASRSCSNTLTIFIYHTSLTKELPSSPVEILNENNINTAFTRSCPTNSEIVVFRKEEWFKVLMHETFHNFALDFSDMNTSDCHARILSIFPVNSEVNLFEAYTEFWARIMNVLFCSYFNTKNKNNIDEFLANTEYFINFESIYSFFQLVKVLGFMNVEYKNLYELNPVSENIRNTLYKEDTNVLSYYVITLILIYNYQSFLSWCKTNNTSLLQFKKTSANQKSFCDFIAKKYKLSKMLKAIDCSNTFFKKLKIKSNKSNKNNNTDLTFLTNNLRMTICELG